jgi:predicted Fe-S protein YdhL (DUF1289 family)
MVLHRATPCIGICSTTYGDLVCRGCKRFAHEIVGWNAFSDDQRDRVWQRLQQLRDGCTSEWLNVVDGHALQSRADELRVAVWADSSPLALAYALLARGGGWTTLESAGIRPQPSAASRSVAEVRREIDAEFLHRSKAAYERSFKIPSDA